MTTPELRPRPLLLVENEPALQHGLLRYLRHAGLEVEIASGSAEATEAMNRTRFAVVISDLRLSGRNTGEGLEVLREAKARWNTCRTILITAYGGPAVASQAARAGVDRYLEKPFSLDTLWRTIAAPGVLKGETASPWTTGRIEAKMEENNHEHA